MFVKKMNLDRDLVEPSYEAASTAPFGIEAATLKGLATNHFDSETMSGIMYAKEASGASTTYAGGVNSEEVRKFESRDSLLLGSGRDK